MTRIHVCEVIKSLNVGGAEVLLVERLLRAPRRNKHYTVICLKASTDELISRLRSSGVTVVDLTSRGRLLAYPCLVAVIRGLAPDVLNTHSPLPATVLRCFVRLNRRRPKLVSTVHSAHQPTAVLRDRLKTALTMSLDRVTRGLDDQTVAVSSLVARSHAARGARRVLTRVHGVDVGRQRHWAERADVVRREFHVPDGAFLVVCVANFRPVKNHRMLIRAAAEVLASSGEAHFVLAGDGPLYADIIREIEQRGLAARVRAVGYVAEAKRLIAAADLLVLSSHYEGLPVVVMEALAAGVPVVSPRVGGVPDLVDSGVNGVLTEPGSARSLASGILRAMVPAVHRKLRAGATASADAVDMAGTADWFEDLYDSLASVPGTLTHATAQATAARGTAARGTAARATAAQGNRGIR